MTNLRRSVMMATRSTNAAMPPRKALERKGRARRPFAGGAYIESDIAGPDDTGDEEDQFRRAADFLRDFHRRSHTLDVIYEEEGRDPSTAARPGQSGTTLTGASRMLKVRTTGSLLDLLPTDGESVGVWERGPTRTQQQRESSDRMLPSEAGSHDDDNSSSNNNNNNGSGAMEWGYFEVNDDPSSDVITDESEPHRTMQGMAARRILHSSCHPRFNAHLPSRCQPRLHFPTCAGKPQPSEKNQPTLI